MPRRGATGPRHGTPASHTVGSRTAAAGAAAHLLDGLVQKGGREHTAAEAPGVAGPRSAPSWSTSPAHARSATSGTRKLNTTMTCDLAQQHQRGDRPKWRPPNVGTDAGKDIDQTCDHDDGQRHAAIPRKTASPLAGAASTGAAATSAAPAITLPPATVVFTATHNGSFVRGAVRCSPLARASAATLCP